MGIKLFPLNISLCKNCGFVFQNPRFSLKKWNEYYVKDYDLIDRPLSVPGPSKPNDGIYSDETVTRLINFQKDPSFINVLEIGAGLGEEILGVAKKLNIKNIYAIEPSLECISYLKKNNVQVIGNSINDYNKEYDNKMDFIILRHVLEHLYWPLESLLIINNLLSEKGLIYLSIPNLFGNAKYCGFGFPHISYFNKITFEYVCAQAKFKQEYISEYGGELFGFYSKSSQVETNIEQLFKDNYEKTQVYLNNNYPLIAHIKFLFKRLISYAIPGWLIKKILLLKRK